MSKIYSERNVFDVASDRLDVVFSEFEQVYLSFSAGKDSGVMLHLALDAARRANKLPLNVLFIDLEAQYENTINFAKQMMEHPDIKPYWICLPLHLRNAVSQFQPHWICWDEDKRDAWVRDLPKHCIHDIDHFPFFRKGMEFEEFVVDFGKWFAGDKKTACLVGIRSDESLNRYRTIASKYKETHDGHQWTTKIDDNLYNAYPIYDWKTEDIWIANGKHRWPYNKIYDLMYLAGLSLSQMRICQPYGDDQRRGLYLFKILEPDTWNAVVNRVEGANFGSKHVIGKNGQLLGNKHIHLPAGHTWRSYTKFLLATMPPPMAEHYRKKILVFLKWWRKHGHELNVYSIPDKDDRKMKNNKDFPSWRRICKVIIKNDYWCKGLSFSQTKKEMEKQFNLTMKYSDIL